jgi:hypothetical protein
LKSEQSLKMILILGDSNFRNTIQEHGDNLKAATGEEIKFFMCTSNESTKIQLEGRTDSPTIVIIGTPLNEIVHKYNANKKTGRAETIKEVLEEQNKLVRKAAEANPQVLFVLVPPFLRLDPIWIKERLSLAVFHVRDFVGDDGPWNITVANQIKLLDSDISDDGVHLNASGKEKLRKSILADILVCKENLGAEPNMDWSSQLSNSQTPTPATLKKRPRAQDEDESMDGEGSDAGAKRAKIDTVLDRIDILMKEITEDRSKSKEEVKELSSKIEENTKQVNEIQADILNMKTVDNAFSAEVREDIDSLENENLRNTVIIRKLKGEAPKEKKHSGPLFRLRVVSWSKRYWMRGQLLLSSMLPPYTHSSIQRRKTTCQDWCPLSKLASAQKT